MKRKIKNTPDAIEALEVLGIDYTAIKDHVTFDLTKGDYKAFLNIVSSIQESQDKNKPNSLF